IRAIARLLVLPPPAKLSGMAEAVSLHVIVGDLYHQFRTQRFPRQIFALTPAALPPGHAFDSLASVSSRFGPLFPGMICKRILAVGNQKFCQLRTFFRAEARAHSDML